MSAATETLYWCALLACLASGAIGLIFLVRGRQSERPGRLWLVPGTVLALLLVGLWIARTVQAGHIPIFGIYESAISLAAAIFIASWVWERRAGFSSAGGPAAALIAGAVLLHAAFYDRGVYALTISERSWVVEAHAFFAWGAFGVLSANVGLSLQALLAGGKVETRKLVTRSLEIGFILHTGMLLSGSVYRFLLFGKAWNFDPIEIMGLVAWLAYGTLLHMVRFARWPERRLAGWCIFVFVLLVISYRVINYFPSWSTYHILDVNLRMHVTGG